MKTAKTQDLRGKQAELRLSRKQTRHVMRVNLIRVEKIA
jgi:hypothetical protein